MSDFLTILAADAQEAVQRCQSQDNPVHRRELIRSLFAAAEGFAWHLKRDVFAHAEVRLDDHERAALLEESYTVNDRGHVKVQDRYLPLVPSLRLAIRIVQQYRPSYVVDFNNSGWPGLVSSVDVRNRLVHPKTVEDLEVTTEEVEQAKRGLDWLMKAQAAIAQAIRDEQYKSTDLLVGLFEGLRKVSPDIEKLRPEIEKTLELEEQGRTADKPRLELIKQLTSTVAKFVEGLVKVFPDLTMAKNIDGHAMLKALITDQGETDKLAAMWRTLERIFPDIRKEQAKETQAEKLIEKFVLDRQEHQARLREHWGERQRKREEIEARYRS